MKTTLKQLRTLIREEISRTLSEASRAPGGAPSAKCPFTGGTKSPELEVFMAFQGQGPAALAEEIVSLPPDSVNAEVVALCCMVNSYDEAVQELVAAGAQPEEAEDLIYKFAPSSESYVYRTLKPWFQHFASGGKCQHAVGHV